MIHIDVYADVVCPWCYVGEKRLGQALDRRPDLPVERRWRSFQLRPEMPEAGLPWREFAVDKFGGEDRMRAAFAHVSAAGEPDGIHFDFDRVASAPNTVDAHRLILHAAEHDLQWETANALFEAYFTHGANLNDHAELVEVAKGADLDVNEVGAFLSGDGLKDAVWRDQEEAGRVGVSSVPFYVFDGRYALSGSQPVEAFLQALDSLRIEQVF
ncbi:MAG: DsbA family oxidoreductase [Rubrobacteraceae bacterium]